MKGSVVQTAAFNETCVELQLYSKRRNNTTTIYTSSEDILQLNYEMPALELLLTPLVFSTGVG